MSDEQVKEIFWQCYNVYWNKWKSFPLTRQSPEWDEVVAEGGDLMRRYPCDLCRHIVSDLIDELEERYKRVERAEKGSDSSAV